MLHIQPLIRIERCQIVEMALVPDLLGILEIDRIDLQQSKIALTVFRAANGSFYRVTGLQRKPSDLRWRDIDIIGPGQIVCVGRAQETESVLKNLDNAFADDLRILFASLFRIANISSCLRKTLAFSTSRFSAKAIRSTGLLLFSSCSFISCMTRTLNMEKSGKPGNDWIGTGRQSIFSE